MTLRYAKPAILDRIGTSHCAIEASAGTGKTFTLEHLVVQCVLDGTPLERILVVTFTRKATLELISRVRAKLEQLVALERDAWREGEPAWEIGERQREQLKMALGAFDRASILTIHGFCQQVLKDAAFEGGRLLQQEAISSEEAFDRVFREQLRTRFAAGDRTRFELALEERGSLEALRELLREAFQEREALVLSEPGAARAALSGFRADLAAAFLAEGAGGPLKSAFKTAGCKPQSLGAMGERLRLVLDGLAAAQASGIPESFWVTVDLDELRKQAGSFGLTGLEGEARELGESYLRLLELNPQQLWVSAFLPPLRAAMERFKRDEGFYDYDDMIRLVHHAVRSEAGVPLVERLRERFQVALIDEFQDTDPQQWEIFQRVFLEAGEGHRLIVVGDPKQAIYGFRSGDLPTYARALQTLRTVTGRDPLQLATNFRSTPGMLQACHQIFHEADGEPFFTGGNVPNYQGPVACGNQTWRLLDGGGDPLPALRIVDVAIGDARRTRHACAQALARTLRETLHSAQCAAGHDPRSLRLEEVLVLTRTAAEGQVIARALKEAGIPAAFYRQDGLFDGPEAKACRDLLLALESPHHASRRAKALLGPFFGLSFQEAESCRELPEQHPVLERLLRWRDLAQRERFGELFSRIIAESGVTQRLLFLEEGQRALTNLLHILELLQQEALAHHGTLLDLAYRLQQWIDGVARPALEDGETQRQERESGAVQILTMHKAKGLEAPVVVLFGGLTRGRAAALHRYHEQGMGTRRVWVGPAAGAPEEVRAWIEQEEVEEGERLLYVALTRAKGQVILPRYLPGDTPPGGSSPFDAQGDPKGTYGCVNRRLRALVDSSSPHIRSTRDLSMPVPPENPAARLAAWHPELPPALSLPDFRGLARQGRPVWLWSYTSLQKGFERQEPPDENQETRMDPPESPLGGPRGGARLGSLVHACFQQADLATFDGRSLEAWKRDPRTQAIAGDLLPDEALAWVHAGLGGELPLPGGGRAVVAKAERLLRELDFMTPYPGGRDLLHGSMDVLFRWSGKTYLLDWKTNRLSSYDSASLQAEMEDSYLLQVKAYTLATCRFLGIASADAYERDFGGVLYVFVRGLPEGGVWTYLPEWAEVQAWERELADLPLERLLPPHAGGQDA